MSRVPRLAAVFAVLCLAASPAQALMMVSFEGVVTNSYVFTDPFGFGTGAGALDGRTVTGTFVYDPDLAPPDSDVAGDSVFHQTTSDSAAWFSTAQVFIDGAPVPVPSFDLFPNFLTTDRAFIGLSDEVYTGFDVVQYNRTLYQYLDASNIHEFNLDIGVDSSGSGADIIDSLSLSAPYSVSDFSMLSTVGTSITSRRTDGGVEAYSFFADFELTPNTLTVTMVPEPTTGALLGIGLLALGRASRGRRGDASRTGIASHA